MPEVRIREALDADRVWAATLLSTSEPWITLLRSFDACLRSCSSPLDRLYIACLDAAPCGLALVRERGMAGAPYLVSIAVADGYRSQGVGSRILGFVESLFEYRHRQLFLCVSGFNLRARVFYERHGYEAVGVLRDFIIEGADEILMVKRLRSPRPPAHSSPTAQVRE